MSTMIFQILTVLIVLAAVFSYLNYRFLRLPGVIGVMVIALSASLLLIALGSFAGPLREWLASVVAGIAFSQLLLHGLLAFLLFAGALQLDIGELKNAWGSVALLAFLGTLLSTFIVGGLMWLALSWMQVEISLMQSLLFGSLIAPTDPIAVLGIMRNVGAPKRIEAVITGESLFNDGIAVVVFTLLLEMTQRSEMPGFTSVATLLLREVLGGAAVGLIFGWVVYRLIKGVDEYKLELLMTIALAMSVYALADALHFSAPIAVVLAGLLMGNHGRSLAMSEQTERRIDNFWELLDEILNAVLFLVIGLEMLVMPFMKQYLYAGLAAIGIVLLARWLTVMGISALVRLKRKIARGATSILTWGGLRGAISVALALSLPPSKSRNLIIAVTYGVVVFSIFVQGLTVGRLIRHVTRDHDA